MLIGVGQPRHQTQVGRCIYCPNKKHLTDEHVVPKQIGGNFVLARASCPDCKKIIDPFEDRLFKSLLEPMMALASGNRRPAPITVNRASGPERLIVPASEHPMMLSIPMARGPSLNPATTNPAVFYYSALPPDQMMRRMERLAANHNLADNFFYHDYNAYDDLMRYLAKIAHCYAVAQFSLGGFEPLLVDAILGKTQGDYRWLGNLPLESPTEFLAEPSQMDAVHIVEHSIEPIDQKNVYFVKVRLFPQRRFPGFTAIAGFPNLEYSGRALMERMRRLSR